MRKIKIISSTIFLILIFSSYSYAESSADQGKVTFESKCVACHMLSENRLIGPGLKGVTQRRNREWLTGFIKDPGRYLAEKDPIATELLSEYIVPMANMGLTDEEVDSVLLYLEAQDAS
jgi:mono/diheme cytochrome c family protein